MCHSVIARTPVYPFALLVLLVGCSDSGTEPEVEPGHDLAGEWVATTEDDLVFTLELDDDRQGGISGEGVLEGPGGAVPMEIVSGSYRHPEIDLLLAAAGFENLTILGEVVSEDRIEGELHGSGFVGLEMMFERQ